MKQMNNNLEVGMLALIIGCSKEANRPIIGSIVRIEAMPVIGDDCTEFFEHSHYKIVEGNVGRVFCSGVNPPQRGSTKSGILMKEGITRLKREHLMPFPPLEEEELQKEKELEY